MLKNRIFVYGLGFGLIAGAVLLQLMHAVERLEAQPAAPAAATVEQLQPLADKLGYKLVTKDSAVYADSEIAAIREQAAEEERSKRESDAAEQAGTTERPSTQAVYISDRMDAASIAELLVHAGVIGETKPFLTALAERELTRKVRSGPYRFDADETVERIVERLTSP